MTNQADKPRIIVITGPTGSGKSDLALGLASELGAEIVSADSMQVYRGFDVGTAKPTPAEQRKVPHHLIDIVDPAEVFNTERFIREAGEAIAEIHGRGNPALVVGGTGLYIKGLLEGLASAPGRNDTLRTELAERWERSGGLAIWEELRAADPELAARLHPNDRTRIIRGLEVLALSGRKLSEIIEEHQFSEHPYESLRFGISTDRGNLVKRIDARTDKMLELGWVEEVQKMLDRGVPPRRGPMKAIGYREICDHLLDNVPMDETAALIKKATREFAKRQMTWFRKMELDWVATREVETILRKVRFFLQ